MSHSVIEQPETLFANPFRLEDLQAFSDDAWQNILIHHGFGLTREQLATAMQGAPQVLTQRITRLLPMEQQRPFQQELARPLNADEVARARRHVLDTLFWELVYWRTPDLYEELTEGEHLHPDLFRSLADDIHGRVVLDAGAGSGRATYECLRQGARLLYAVEPSPGLLHILQQKLLAGTEPGRVRAYRGRFDALPLAENSVDVALSCSAFTAAEEQGGESGLAELKRVTRAGGKIVIIWPRRKDHAWFRSRGFQYVSLPVREEMVVHFRSLEVTRHCARLFYGHNQALMEYLQTLRRPEIPFSLLGMNPPRDYYWLTVEK